eukprot:3104124-Lingulodinium_polyedra.AAC.1
MQHGFATTGPNGRPSAQRWLHTPASLSAQQSPSQARATEPEQLEGARGQALRRSLPAHLLLAAGAAFEA